jgi:hypothetical protein
MNSLYLVLSNIWETSVATIEKLPIKNDEWEEGGLFYDPFWGNSPKKKPCIRKIYY